MEMPVQATASRVRDRGRNAMPHTVSVVIGALVAIIFTLALGPAGATANQTFRIAFDENDVGIGPVGNLPLQEITSSASIEGTVDPRGRVTIPKDKFRLPVLGIDEPIKIRGFMGVEDDASGTWDRKTGKLEIDAKVGLWLSIDRAEVIQGLQGAGVNLGGLGPIIGILSGGLKDLTCGFSPMNVTFTTETTSLGSGQRFTKGLDGPGALTVGWSRLGPFAGKTQVLFFDVCTTLRGLAPTLITSLVGNSIPGLDIGGLDLAGLLENLDSVDLGPSSLTISRTVDQSRPASLAMASPRAAIKARSGKPTKIPIRVSNPGDVAASGVRICPRIPRSARARGACVTVGNIAPGDSITRTLTVRPDRSARTNRKSARRSSGKVRTVRLSIVVTGSGLPSQTRGLTLRVIG